MLPVQLEFPKFVADQLLTSDDLNELFGYLDEQNRLTRTNLLGIGIVCGLQLQVDSAKTQVTITKGCGVTSEGYQVTVDTKSYSQYKKYKVDTPRVYEKFKKDDGSGGKIPIDIWELKQPAVDPDLQSIDAAFLKDKVILLFVELKEEENKNCDPSSCDDKGINVSVSFLPMAVSADDAKLLMGTTSAFGANTFTTLPELRMKRWDVPNTSPVTSSDIFDAYLKVLDKTFIDSVETTLKNVYTSFGAIVAPDYSANPFIGLSNRFQFLYNRNLTSNQLIHLQYYYDLFSDLLLAYQEFRVTGTDVLSTCCPDSTLFPRHLLLGEAIPAVSSGALPYRHYFIYSPLFDKQNIIGGLRSLFNRLVLLIDQFFLPAVQGNNTKEDSFLRITPSTLGNVSLSKKAIPYYYQPNSGSKPLYYYWDQNRTRLNDQKRNLSYNAALYNATDAFVTTPLNFDLEPYNFLRIEGIVGKSYVHVLKQVKYQVAKNRLPVDIIALNTSEGLSSLKQQIPLNEFRGSKETGMEMLCHFQDLESMYDSMRREILCLLCKELKYYYDFVFQTLAVLMARLKQINFAGQLSQVDLFDTCATGYKVRNRSLGIMIEFFYRKGLTDETLTVESLYEAMDVELEDINNDGIPDILNGQQTAIFLALLNFFKIPLGIIRLSTLLPEDLADFDAKAYCEATDKLGEYAKSLKAIFNMFGRSQQTAQGSGSNATTNDSASVTGTEKSSIPDSGVNASSNSLTTLATAGNSFAGIILFLLLIEDLLDHLDVLIYNCKCGALLSLKTDYLRRYAMLTRLRQFGFFTQMHPGIQHKAGVPMGGTFIVVYHSKKRRIGGALANGFFRNKNAAELADTSKKEAVSATGSFINKKIFLAGFVQDDEGEPVTGATITVSETGDTFISNASGLFKIKLDTSPATLLVEAAGFQDLEQTFSESDDAIRLVLTRGDGNAMDELAAGMVIADFYLPYRCCSDCPPIQYIVNDVGEEPKPNQGPNANAGEDQSITLPKDSVTLNGSASSDPDGTIAAFQWAKLTGPGTASFATPASSQTDVTNLQEGVYIFELSVTDDKGSMARDTVQVTVNPAPPPPNKPPVADAGKDRTIELNPNTFLVLDGSGSTDEGGTIVAFKWQQIGGPAAHIASSGLAQTPVDSLQEGVYEFMLTVTDNDGASASQKVVIKVVLPPNLPPVANAGPDQSITLNAISNIATLDGSASTDPEGGGLQFAWSLIGGPNAPNFTTPKVATTTVSGIVAGDYTFQLMVTDNQGNTATDNVVIHVAEPNAPLKTCGPLSDLMDGFGALKDTVIVELFNEFGDRFKFFKEARKYFDGLAVVQNLSNDQQIEFFATPFAGQNTQKLIAKWLENLQIIILQNPRLSSLAMGYYRIFLKLAMYIVCIQKQDYDPATVPMIGVFELAQKHMEIWKQAVQSGAMAQDVLPVIKLLVADFDNEVAQVVNNGESASKPNYVNELQNLIEFLSNF